ncbi:MAG TPA: SIS domain-containing protein [Planctomycetota bacterium]|nr:SIS domain-containing protein [Planctomycetota bacterium]
MSKLLADIEREPAELAGVLARVDRDPALGAAAAIVAAARQVVITGIGSSWHAGMAVAARCAALGIPATLADASDLLHFAALAPGQALIVLSRSGASVEIVGLVERARVAGTPVVAITNTPTSALARGAQVVIGLGATFDHAISIGMYSALAVAGTALIERAAGRWDAARRDAIAAALAEAGRRLPGWSAAIADSPWLARDASTYFLARDASLASASETRLLWEEAAKAPATALTTGHFRHGPQEIIRRDLRVALWLDPARLRRADLDLVADLRRHEVRVALIGHALDGAADLALDVPATPEGWQFAVDCIPAQLMAERVARLRGVDCDGFTYCPYVITGEGGLAAAGRAGA